jgi:small subunit ribosomal protein S6
LIENYYEGMFILDSARFGADPEAAGAEVAGIIQKAGGEVVAHRPWQDAKLAYAIDGHKKGLYYLTFFTGPGAAAKQIAGIVNLNENVIRHLVLKHPKTLFDRMVQLVKGGDAFRPEQIEDSPIAVGREREEEVFDDVIAEKF